MDKGCTVDACARPHYANGWCGLHYARLRRTGTADDPTGQRRSGGRKPRSVEERLEGKYERCDVGCWDWTASLDSKGYGQISVEGRPRRAHIVMYELRAGPVPDGLELDHLCSNRECVKPDHLEPVTHAENMRRSLNAAKTRCAQGHEFTPDNTWHDENGNRNCRQCNRDNQRRIKERRRTERLSV